MKPQFPCDRLPDAPAEARLLGVYPQRRAETFMQRTKLGSGRITPAQLRLLAALAQRFCADLPMHLTTRQDIELFGLSAAALPAVQAGMAEGGLTGLGACGDTLRNITVCPLNGLCRGSHDVEPLAQAIRTAAEALPWIHELPRKFKISLSGCSQACGRPWINDVGLISRADGRLQAVVAGSLGARPGTGVIGAESLDTREAVAFVLAALRLFHAEGDRQNRTKARLRHVREKLGDAPFLEKLVSAFHEELRRNPDLPALPLPKVTCAPAAIGHLRFPLGDLTVSQARAVADAAELAGGEVRIGIEHDIYVAGPVEPAWGAELRPLLNGARIVACPGTSFCSRGIACTRGLAEQLGAALPGTDMGIAISGCPNNCSQAAVADIGLVGLVRRIGEQRTECYRVTAGGGCGADATLGRELHPALPAGKVPAALQWLIEQHRQSGSSESFQQFVARKSEALAKGLADFTGV